MRVCFPVLPSSLLLIAVVTVRADSFLPPSSYREKSADGRYVFVMIPPDITLDDELKPFNDGPGRAVKDEIRAIRGKYQRSGLYPNDGSADPLWTVDWYKSRVVVPSDGVHLVAFPGPHRRTGNRENKVTADDLKQVGLEFYAKGKLIREAPIAEYVDRTGPLSATWSHFGWCEEARADDTNGRLIVTTLDDNRIAVDLATGTVVSKERLIRAPKKAQEKVTPVRVEPTSKWFGQVADVAVAKRCPEAAITTAAEFERVWKALRGSEKVPAVDFGKAFAVVRTDTNSKLTDLTLHAVAGEAWVSEVGESEVGKDIDGFSYALFVFPRGVVNVEAGRMVSTVKK
jgi:hypothetical protein